MATTFATHGLTIKVGQTLRINGNKRLRHVVAEQTSPTSFTLVDGRGQELGLWDCESHFCTLRNRGRRVSFPREATVEVVSEVIPEA